MKEQDVAFIAKAFNLDTEIVKSSVEDGTLSKRLEDAMSNKVVYSGEDFEKFKNNYAEEVKDKYFGELVDLAKKGEVPHDLHSPIKGAVTEQLERQLSKKYNVDSYSDVFELVDSINKPASNGNNDEFLKQIEELKTANKTLLEEKENAVKDANDKMRSELITRDRDQILSSIPFDFSDAKADELEATQTRAKKILQNVFDADYDLDYDNGKLVVKDKSTGELVKDQATREPLPASKVFTDVAKYANMKLKSPDNGGQGGKSSGKTSSYESLEDFESTMKSQGIRRDDPKYYEEYKAFKESNIE